MGHERPKGGDGADLTEIEGEVVRRRAERGDWSTGVLRSKDGTTLSYAGSIVADVGDRVKIRGRWYTDPKWGEQFKVVEFEPVKDLSADGLARWLASCKAFKGVGPKYAGYLAQFFASDFEDAIANRPEHVAEVTGIPLKVVEAMAVEWAAHAEMHRAVQDLMSIGVGGGKAKKIYEAYGATGAAIIRKNPYWLIRKVEGFGFLTVDAIAKRAGVPKEHPDRIREGVLFVVDELTEDKGDTWARAEVVVDAAVKMLALDCLGARGLIDRALRAECSGPAEPWELPAGDPQFRAGADGKALVAVARTQADFDAGTFAVFPARLAKSEAYVSAWVAQAVAQPPRHGMRVTADEVMAAYPALEGKPGATPEQAAAVAAAFGSRLSIITGGAGTGKTFAVSMIRGFAEAADLHVSLCAPTGKAARRLHETVGFEASTIHLLLQPCFSGGEGGTMRWGFAHPDSLGFLKAHVIVVDEVSMVDVSLLHALFRAIGPDTSVVLIGDPNQLPPVGPGSFLRDAIKSGAVPVSRLAHVHRNAGFLKEATCAVLDGRVSKGAPRDDSANPALQPWYVASNLNTPESVRSFVVFLFEKRLREFTVVDPVTGETRPLDVWNDVQVLVPMKKGECGLDELNKALQGLSLRLRGIDYDPAKLGRPQAGDKIVWTRNRYDLGLLNGTTGRVMSIEPKTGDVTLAIDGAELPVKIPNEDAREMMLAYAMTVHRSQGSEYPVVVFVSARQHRHMLYRSLAYTAVSRARKSCMWIGDAWAIAEAAKRENSEERRTLATLCKSTWCRLPERPKEGPPTGPPAPGA